MLPDQVPKAPLHMSDSSFIPERQLLFSPGLAATIGLEEAILLQHLHALFEHHDAQVRDNHAWLSVERDYLLRSLPFWSVEDLHRISRNLVDKGVLLIEYVEQSMRGWGSELFVGIRQTREFGPVIAAGIGGVQGHRILRNARTDIGQPEYPSRVRVSGTLRG